MMGVQRGARRLGLEFVLAWAIVRYRSARQAESEAVEALLEVDVADGEPVIWKRCAHVLRHRAPLLLTVRIPALVGTRATALWQQAESLADGHVPAALSPAASEVAEPKPARSVGWSMPCAGHGGRRSPCVMWLPTVGPCASTSWLPPTPRALAR